MQRLSELGTKLEEALEELFSAVSEISNEDCEKMRNLMGLTMLDLGKNKDLKAFLEAKDSLIKCHCVERVLHAKGYNIDKIRMCLCKIEKISERGLK